jgi:protein ImuB
VHAQTTCLNVVSKRWLESGEANMKQELYACVHVAEFPAQALLRLRQDLKAKPVVVLHGRAPHEEVCSFNQHARLKGISLRMTRLEAQSLEGLTLLSRSAESEASARDVLLECAAIFSPRIEEASQGTSCSFVLEITGTERLFGPPARLAERLRSSLAEAGFRASIAVCSNFDTARFKAATVRGITLIHEGEEASALANLPVSALDLEEEHLETFSLWGIRTFSQLADLPETELVTRLGQQAQKWLALARGTLVHTFQPIEPAFALKEFFEFETLVEQIESLLFVAARMIDCLTTRAGGRALSLASLAVDMRLESGRTHHITIRPALPTIDRKFLLKLLHLEIAAHPPPAAVVALTLSAEAGQSSKVQLGLFAPQMQEPSRLDVTIARLKAIVGQDRVGSPVLEDTHRSGSFHMENFAIHAGASEQKSMRSRMALRRMRPPVSVRVVLQGMKPVAFRDRQSRFDVAASYGPWKTAGCWWSTDGWDMEEWDVLAAKSDGASIACLLVHDRKSNEWQLEAVYD